MSSYDKERNLGFTDEAAEEDRFGITDYIGGLATFIKECNTPLTLSIQGSWGTGKTSIMNLIKNEIIEFSPEIKTIWFNTWQFSQFNMDDQLALSLLSSLISEFKITDKETIEKTNVLLKGLRAAYMVGKDVGLAYLDHIWGGTATEYVKNAFGEAEKRVAGGNHNEEGVPMPEIEDPTIALQRLRMQFADCVKKTLEGQTADQVKRTRIVIFIDDLDRLEPRKAVELLEVLKIFLDCKDCVFVLAIDFDVVCQGVAVKYGTLSDNDEDNKNKGRSFFDKIIQVPFKMPVARYNIEGYVENCFKKIGFEMTKEAIKPYVDLIKYSIGTNPRSMKRLFNSYQLLTIVAPKDMLKAEKNKQLLFAVLCLQYCSEKLYNFLIRNSEHITSKTMDSVKDADHKLFIESLEEDGNIDDIDQISDDDLAAAKPFMEKFYEVVDTDGKNGIDPKEMENFREVLGLSSITDTSDTDATRRTGMSLEKYFEPYINNPVLSWMMDETDHMKNKGFTVSAFSTPKSGNYLRVDYKEHHICDCVAGTRVGWAVDCFLRPSDGRDKIIEDLKCEYGKSINVINTSYFTVRGIADQQFFRMLIDKLLSVQL